MARKASCPPPPLPPLLLAPDQSLLPSPTLLRSPKGPSFKPLFWKKVVPSSNKTIWQQVSEQQKHVNFNEEVFQKLFQKKADPTVRRSRSLSPGRSPCRVLNDKRFQALQILMKNISLDEVYKIMESCKNLKKCSLDIDTLARVTNMITSNELKKLRSCPADCLEQPERFLLKLFAIENFYEKVTCLQHHSHFQENFQPLRQQIHTLDSAYKLLCRPHDKLCQVLALVLLLGNKMNADSSSRSNALGFKLDILTELKDVRSCDGSSNLLKFIVQSYVDSHPEISGNDYPVPVPNLLMPAASVTYPDLKSKYKTLLSEIEACKKICMQISNKDPFQKEISAFVDESSKDLKCVHDELNEAESLFKEVVRFYGLDKTESISSQEFLQIWLSFSQTFYSYWEHAFANRRKIL
ncbi:PREDICTED: formin-2-like [Amphimedon queenslandica]|uniref:FH2 domain-containing protein n=1 Tax=Amphimedon queenslandica TaxID=400682 RepID=A0A1X7VVD5_AMPQE|nr:PREDICTED: formin-2-like [Amphimedon queenslandica]|eukprot:XP_011410562.1 PREDICTED: formin-2-like [Amphimedon queenslandica]